MKSSILDRLINRFQTTHHLTVIQGVRGSGKTTTAAGTTKGKTLLLQSDQEAGSKTAEKMNPDLTVAKFSTLEELDGVIDELTADHGYKYIIVDSLSEIADMVFDLPNVQAEVKKDTWAGFRTLGKIIIDKLTILKRNSAACEIILTLAVDTTLDANGNIVKVVPCIKGKMALGQLLKKADIIITIHAFETKAETGKLEVDRKLILKPWNGYQNNRIDGMTDQENPGMMDADMNKLFNFLTGKKEK